MDVVFSELTVWHWVGLALILLAFEMMLGTFDLLWIAIAAATAAVYSLIAPDSMALWQYQVGVFTVASVIFLALGRRISMKLRNPPSTHPELNERNTSMVGKTAIVMSVFQGGFGRVKINDSEWRAQTDATTEFAIGDTVEITGVEGATVKVKSV
ncbi:NfeD family protein [Hirschia litorea]|uniref:NfeD family protein n=1 Tax=Hirschia litorea TaxID=1199156 RepID=A0ABW2IIX2_9PROT